MNGHTFKLRWHWYSDTEGAWEVVEAPRLGGLQEGEERTLVKRVPEWSGHVGRADEDELLSSAVKAVSENARHSHDSPLAQLAKQHPEATD